MSEPTENSNNTTPIALVIPEVVIQQEKKPLLICLTCESKISDEDSKLTCMKTGCGKTLCVTCIDSMLRVLFSEPELHYPMRCSGCSNPYQINQIDGLLRNGDIYVQYMACVLPLFWSNVCLQDDEELARCPFCPYFEIHTTDSCSLDFLTCQNPSCGIRSCLNCLNALENDVNETQHRLDCIDLQKYRQMIAEAIESGSKQRCPDCDLAGLKDNGCTHMNCERCGTVWCYLCGMNEDDCLVDDGDEQSLRAHNRDWNEHQGRCPMLLISIQEMDDQWPDNDEDCLEYFHRYKTLSKLYEVMKTVGEDKLESLNDQFNLIDVTGYTIDEIKDQQHRILINYPNEDE